MSSGRRQAAGGRSTEGAVCRYIYVCTSVHGGGKAGGEAEGTPIWSQCESLCHPYENLSTFVQSAPVPGSSPAVGSGQWTVASGQWAQTKSTLILDVGPLLCRTLLIYRLSTLRIWLQVMQVQSHNPKGKRVLVFCCILWWDVCETRVL